jgi:hypothetical protein
VVAVVAGVPAVWASEVVKKGLEGKERGRVGRTEDVFVSDRYLLESALSNTGEKMKTYPQNMIRSIRLQRLPNSHHLILKRPLIRIYIDRHKDTHIHGGILDRLKDERGLVAVCAVETEFVGQLGEKVDVAGYVCLGCAASEARG